MAANIYEKGYNLPYDHRKQPGAIRALLIPYDDAKPCSVITFDSDDFRRGDYLRLNQYVGGDYESVTLNDNLSAWLATNGKELNSPYNRRATVFIRLYRLIRLGKIGPVGGDVVIMGGVDDDGNTLSAPDEVIERLTSL